MAIEGTVDKLTIKIQTEGVTTAQKQLTNLSGTLKMLDRLNATMTGGAMAEAGEEARDASADIAAAGEEIEVTAEKADKASVFWKKLGSIFRGVKTDGEKTTGIFANLKMRLEKNIAPLQNFASALKRIATYRVLRSIIKSITAGIGEGIKNIYNYSRAVGTSLAPAMDKAKSATLTFKNSIGAALAPVMEALIPVIVRVCEWLTTLNNLIAKVFAILTGKSSYTAAVNATATWGENLSSAAGAAKELRRQLLGFDELNVLSDPASGGGGGGGSTTPDYSSMFEEIQLPDPGESPFVDWLRDFKLVFEDVVLDWSNINGEQLAEKIISGLFTVAGLIVGGIPGAIVGFLLSLFVNKWLFNRDGRIDAEELTKMIMAGLLGITAGVAGGLIGGSLVGIISFALMAALTVGLSNLLFNGDGKLDRDEIQALIVAGLLGITAGIIGFAVGGPLGATIGFTVGVLLGISIEGIYKKATGSTDPVKDFVNKLFGGEKKVAVEAPEFQSPEEYFEFYSDLGGFYESVQEDATKSGEIVADSFTTSYGNVFEKNFKTVTKKNARNWRSLTKDTSGILSSLDVINPFKTINTNMDKGMRLVKDGDRTRWVTESQYVTEVLKATDVTTPFEVINTNMQAEWNSIKKNTDGNAGAVSKTITDKLNGTNVVNPMKRIESDLGNSFNLFNSLTDTKMTQVGGTISGKLRSTDVASPMDALKSKLSEKLEEMKQTSSKQGSGITSNLTTSFNNMKSDVISAVAAVKDGVRSPFNAISSGAAKVANNVAGSVRDAVYSMNQIRFVVPSWVPGVGGQTFAFNARTPYRDKYVPELMAEGGLVKQGQLFVARERGPELVGTYNSHTAVMNNDQIVESVSEGVYRAVVAAMGDQSTTVNIDGKTLFEIVTERNNAQVRRTGRSPLLV